MAPSLSAVVFLALLAGARARAPRLNSTADSIDYKYVSPNPYSWRYLGNPWILLCPLLKINDTSSGTLSEAYITFDPASYDGDSLRYVTRFGGIEGYFDPDAGLMSFHGGGTVAAWQQALRTVSYKAKPTLSVRDHPNEHSRRANITVVDGTDLKSLEFDVHVRLTSAHVVISDKSVTIITL
ncbi:hypothetical protein M885DRAFT_620237 [Pelagophyceae sp. CCMP2097]|nr:hypothetical protein M885DRAFT_620237 [Pelagophyceae sp. CCMP2097]